MLFLPFPGHFLTSGRAGTAGWWVGTCVSDGDG